MTYEDQLYVWRLLLRNNLAGKIAPAHPWDRRPTEYALLVPDKLAVAEVNAVSDIPITVDHLPSILARFRHLDPPYSSLDDGAKEHNAKNRKVVAAALAVGRRQPRDMVSPSETRETPNPIYVLTYRPRKLRLLTRWVRKAAAPA